MKFGFVYIVESKGFFKIGMTDVNPNNRISAMQTGNPFPITLVSYISVENPRETEIGLHYFLEYNSESCRVSGEWFQISEDLIQDLNKWFNPCCLINCRISPRRKLEKSEKPNFDKSAKFEIADIDRQKKYLEKCLKAKISDSTYYRIKKVMLDNHIPMVRSNLKIVADIKNECRRHKISLENGIRYFTQMVSSKPTLTGKQLFDYAKEITENKPHRTTIVRWFTKDFEPEKNYNSVEINKVLFHAFMYNIRNKDNQDITSAIKDFNFSHCI